jgi:ubiquinone biosynthesis O-methyltransferase
MIKYVEELAPDTVCRDNLFYKENIYDLFKGKTVLDAGCATGYFTNKIAEKAKVVVGVDLREINISIAKKMNKKVNAKYLVMNIENLSSFKNASFDIIICQEVLEHLSNRKKALKEFSRVLKKDGLLLIASTIRPLISLPLFLIIKLNEFIYSKNSTEIHKGGMFIDIKKLERDLENFKLIKKIKYRGIIVTFLNTIFISTDRILRIFFLKQKINDVGDNASRLNLKSTKIYVKHILPIIKFLSETDSLKFDNSGLLTIFQKAN